MSNTPDRSFRQEDGSRPGANKVVLIKMSTTTFGKQILIAAQRQKGMHYELYQLNTEYH